MTVDRTQRTPPNLPTSPSLTQGDLITVWDPVSGFQQVDPYTLSLGTQLDAISQIAGFTSANIVEVEAATKALRVTVRATTRGGEADSYGFTVTRHSWGRVASMVGTTGNIGAPLVIFACGWQSEGYGCINKIMVSQQLAALVGARTLAASRLDLSVVDPIADLHILFAFGGLGTGPQLWLPPLSGIAGGGVYGSVNSHNRQHKPPEMQIVTGSNMGTSSGLALGAGASAQVSAPLSSIYGNVSGVAGTLEIPPSLLFDARSTGQYQPLMISKSKGYQIGATAGGAATSLTINYGISMQWDEWVPDTGR